MSSNEPGNVEAGTSQEHIPTRLGPKEAFARFIDNLKLKAGVQSKEFGFVSENVTYREDHLKQYGETDMGIQADVTFDGTRYERVFDNALGNLRRFADNGTESTGWRSDENSRWGQLRKVELPNGRRYEVIDETRPDDKGVSVSIRPDHEGRPDGNSLPEGAYYFSDKDHFGGRKIEICGAHMENVDEVMKDVKAVVDIASKG